MTLRDRRWWCGTTLLALGACGEPMGHPLDELEGGAMLRQGAGRHDVVLAEITAWNASLAAAERDEKFQAMAESPFAFLRGSNHLYWMDMAGSPLLHGYGGPGTAVWLQGDLHASNYGTFDDDQAQVIYDLDDFDESVVADYQLDLWRMAASVVLVGRDNGLDDDEIALAVDGLTEHYLDALEDFRGNDHEDDWVVDASRAYGLLDELIEWVEDHRSRQEMLDEWTVLVGGAAVFDLAHEDLAAVDPATRAAIVAAMRG